MSYNRISRSNPAFGDAERAAVLETMRCPAQQDEACAALEDAIREVHG